MSIANDLSDLPPARDLSADDQADLAAALRRRYEAGDDIRGLADATGYSYGWTRNRLLSAGTRLRSPGRPSHRSRRHGR